MAHYRLPELDLSTRMTLALEMLPSPPVRRWGRVTELASTYDVSRTFLYGLRDRAFEALVAGLSPCQPGPQPRAEALVIARALIERAIVLLPLLKGSVRDIQLGLDLLFHVHHSVGYISQTLSVAGERAVTHNRGISVSLPILGEGDEIFQGRQPCLTLVDGRSFLVVNLTPAASRDAITWGLTYLDVLERGIQFQDLACDGGTGLRAGVREAKLAIPLRPDLFHLLQEAHRLTQRLERAAYQAIEAAERARRAALEARGVIRRRGRRLQVKLPLPQAEIQEARAIETFDHWCWLLGEIRQALEPITPTDRIVSLTETQATLETAVELLKQLDHAGITAFANDLQDKLPELIAPLEWLTQHLTPLLQGLDMETQAWIVWTWQQRQSLHLTIDSVMPEALRSVARAVWDTLGLFHRSSSLAESLHSWLRPYLQIHRGVPKWLLPLLQLYWNHHKFERGKRAGSSPVELAGASDVSSLAEVLDQLSRPGVAPHQQA